MGKAKFDNISILIVEDHSNMRNLWRTILMGFGIRKVLEAADAMTAVDLLRNDPVDIMLVDQYLPDLSGAELMRMVRRADDMPFTIPAVACTSDTRRSTLRELINSGVDEVLAKPVSAEQAWQKLSAVVNKRRSFVRTTLYLGPDRRRREVPYSGPERRAGMEDDDGAGDA